MSARGESMTTPGRAVRVLLTEDRAARTSLAGCKRVLAALDLLGVHGDDLIQVLCSLDYVRSDGVPFNPKLASIIERAIAKEPGPVVAHDDFGFR